MSEGERDRRGEREIEGERSEGEVGVKGKE